MRGDQTKLEASSLSAEPHSLTTNSPPHLADLTTLAQKYQSEIAALTRRPLPCDCCRQQKKKCDRNRPVCNNCAQRGLQCEYLLPPQKQALAKWRARLVLENRLAAAAESSTQHDFDDDEASNASSSELNLQQPYSSASPILPQPMFSQEYMPPRIFSSSTPYVQPENQFIRSVHSSITSSTNSTNVLPSHPLTQYPQQNQRVFSNELHPHATNQQTFSSHIDQLPHTQSPYRNSPYFHHGPQHSNIMPQNQQYNQMAVPSRTSSYPPFDPTLAPLQYSSNPSVPNAPASSSSYPPFSNLHQPRYFSPPIQESPSNPSPSYPAFPHSQQHIPPQTVHGGIAGVSLNVAPNNIQPSPHLVAQNQEASTATTSGTSKSSVMSVNSLLDD
ncbi:hypothetical protein BCR33DRAFT_761647 [Rhizoclosmatium globosum]|uniref:Zn(2)-C6 fungal-type domain-containing protein n=1 Tax=Rhizoclosmatium globosum TaxID=329046 RepID=A0A1Y2D018_9FUNG|nr:hypothetical protein BCR33DRAFT_761647 [Rhizoclosmatium globosum]|eukprot:ORY52464.1 hypothetical protein BCR33DRAFT_761647 [Rhizoclosmatium globosum]